MLLFVLILLFIALGCLSFCDIKYRHVTNSQIISVLVLIIASNYWFSLQWSNWLIVLVIIITGIFGSYFNVLGAADTKLAAVLVLAIKPEYLILFYFLGALFILFICGVYAVAIKCRWASRQRGIPLIPAISLAGWCCIGLTII